MKSDCNLMCDETGGCEGEVCSCKITEPKTHQEWTFNYCEKARKADTANGFVVEVLVKKS